MKILQAEIFANKSKMSDEEWLESRKQGIGGSDAAAIVGLSPYQSAFAVYLDKLGLCPEKEDSEAMRQGRDLEEYVAQRFVEKMKDEGQEIKVRNCNYILRHPKNKFMLANVDRLIIGEKAGLECKTTSVYNKTDFASGDIPPNYYVQCQHYMAVTGAEKWYLAVLILNRGFYTFEIPRNEEDVASLILQEKDFWENNVIKKIEPAPDGSERAGEVIKHLYPVAEDELTVDLFAYGKEIDSYLELNEQIKLLENQKEEAKQRIQVFMKEASIGMSGERKVSWKTTNKSSVDTAKLKEQYKDVYSECLKSSSYRVFKIN